MQFWTAGPKMKYVEIKRRRAAPLGGPHYLDRRNLSMSIDFESLKDKAVVFAQSGVTKAKELTDTGIAKAKEISEIGKLKVQNSTEQEAIRKAYSELGKLYYAERGSAPEAAYADLCQRITDALARISYNNERIADIKAAGHLDDEEVEAVGAEAEAEGPCCCDKTEAEDDKPEE